MKQINAVFLAETGITSTSANHLANIAQETIVGHEAQLSLINFVSSTLDIVGSEAHSGKLIARGYTQDKVQDIPRLLGEMAEMNSFCAWTREAIKAKEQEQQAILNTTFEQWCKKEGYIIPEYPYDEEVTEQDIVAELNIKERNRYLRLEAFAATIGKFIHSGRELSKAREQLKQAISKPYATQGEGASTLIYHHTPSVSEVEVDQLFFTLQQLHREKERELNQMKWMIKQRLSQVRLERIDAQRARQTAVNEEMQRLQAEFGRWQTREHARVSKLKIAIPEELQPTLYKLSEIADRQAH